MRCLVTGGTGFIGQALCEHWLAGGHEVLVASRSAARVERAFGGRVAAVTDLADLPSQPGVDVVVNLAGANIGEGRWSEDRKRELVESRLAATRAVVDYALRARPAVVISSSAIGYYGDRGDEILDETAAPGSDFAARLCVDWEAAAAPLAEQGVRTCLLRTGIVLEKGGGPLAPMMPLFRLGLGGPLGNGRQYVSWIHRDDVVELIAFLAETAGVSGAVNATAPHPLPQRDFARALGAALGRPALLPAPGFALRLALGEMAEMLLGGQRVLPQRAQQAGFAFRYPTLPAALEAIFGD